MGSCDGAAEAREEAALAIARFVEEEEGGGGGEESEEGEASGRERRGHAVEIVGKLEKRTQSGICSSRLQLKLRFWNILWGFAIYTYSIIYCNV